MPWNCRTFGQRLRLARKHAGLSTKMLAGQISPGVSARRIGSYEADSAMPSTEILMSIARVLGVSLDYFIPGQIDALHRIEFRRQKDASAQNRALAGVTVVEQLETYLTIEDFLELAPADDPFGNLATGCIQNLAAVDRLAGQLRDRWHLGDDPIPSLTGLLEEKGIRVLEADFPEDFQSLRCDVKRNGNEPDIQVIVVSSRSSIENRRLGLARELAYQIINIDRNSDVSLGKAVKRFARAFLIPAEHLAEKTGRGRTGTTCHEVMRLKHVYGVSATVMLQRLRETGFLRRSAVQQALLTHAKNWHALEPQPIGIDEGFGSFERPTRFEQLVWRALGERVIHPVRAARFLRVPFSDIEEGIRGTA